MICLICNKEYSNKGMFSHLKNKHNLTSEEYFRKFNSPRSCIICGKETPFLGFTKGFADVCSFSCSRKKGSRTTKKRYGYIPGAYGSIEHKKYMLNTYGVENAQQNSQIHERTLQTTEKRYGVKYSFLTEQARINSNINSHSVNTKTKIKNTCIQRYGVTNPAKVDFVKKKSRNTVLERHNLDFSEKRFKLSYKELNTLASPTELDFYKQISSKYTILYNISSKEYPYLCDFYIKELNLFIELNITWTHGWHYFNENDEQDQIRLKEMINKNNSYYNAAIDIWTNVDLKKKAQAINNNLNFVVVWNDNQINKLIEDINNGFEFSNFIDYNCLKIS